MERLQPHNSVYLFSSLSPLHPKVEPHEAQLHPRLDKHGDSMADHALDQLALQALVQSRHSPFPPPHLDQHIAQVAIGPASRARGAELQERLGEDERVEESGRGGVAQGRGEEDLQGRLCWLIPLARAAGRGGRGRATRGEDETGVDIC